MQPWSFTLKEQQTSKSVENNVNLAWKRNLSRNEAGEKKTWKGALEVEILEISLTRLSRHNTTPGNHHATENVILYSETKRTNQHRFAAGLSATPDFALVASKW